MSTFEVMIGDPTPDGEQCSAMGEECPMEANAEVAFRVHGFIVSDDLFLCEDHLREVIDSLKSGRFDEVDDIGGFTICHGGAE